MSKESTKSKFNFDVKQTGMEGLNIGSASLGFFGGNALFNKVVPEKLRSGFSAIMVTFAMLLVGAFVATQTQKPAIKSAAYGLGVYSFTKMLNSATAITPSVSGLGFALPESISSVIKSVVPNLGESETIYDVSDMRILAPGSDQIAAVDAEYEILNAAYSEDLIAGGALNLPELNGGNNLACIKNPNQVPKVKPMCSINGTEELVVA